MGTYFIFVGQLMTHLSSNSATLIGESTVTQIYSCLVESMTTTMPVPLNLTLLRGILETGHAIVWATGVPTNMLKPLLDAMPANMSREMTSALAKAVAALV